ncbi:hypothetical protein BT96DRAFT_935364 [Gymnopus androsaceus JB14]|uniref:Wings apart-like protein C-terminal domain-containing protein n=1 Tax=Gymnopus androsaceus JB14 TaxID=1447944 RepID=A0A6A4I4P7_9AGAR|nr:hypothetical protein BT96DRAFT_935364 [Gymnopus androsaceus JB14]
MDLARPDDEDQERISTLREDVENDLDEILSPRSSSESKTIALRRLEVLIGSACVKSSSQTSPFSDMGNLMRLQDGFECNSCSLGYQRPVARLELLAGLTKPGVDDEHYFTVKEIATQIVLSLSIIQGIALNHPRSKRWLGRIKPLEIFVDLLLASRHVSPTISASTSSSGSPKSGPSPDPSLTSTILDTILCILVDSTPALRAFEQCNGVQAIVKILKRAGTPREVR